MRLIPVLREGEDPQDPKQQWISYARAYWAEEIGGPAQISGLAGGLRTPEINEYNLAQILPIARTIFGGFRPWSRGLSPPAFTPLSLPATQVVPPAVYGPGSNVFSWFRPPPSGHVPLANLVAPRSVYQLDPLASPYTSPGGKTISQLTAHAANSAALTFANYGIHRNEALNKKSFAEVAGMLKRGAEMGWEAGKVVIKVGGRVLNPLGRVWDLYELYKFVKWVDALPEKPNNVPGCSYEPAPNAIVCRFKDGTVASQPAWQLPEYVKYRF